MFKFFDFIINFLESIVGYILNLFEMLLYVISFIGQGVLYAVTCIQYLPPWVLPFVLASIGFSVVMFILNR